MIKTSNFKQLEIASAKELRTWLEIHHTQKESIWLVTFKKEITDKYVSVDEILDELVCFGWIDGIRRKVDEERTMQLISPRKVQYWTRTYKDRFAKLESEGRMTNAGRLSVEISKKAGLWDFMDDVDKILIPDDLVDSLNEKGLTQTFEALSTSYKRNLLRYIKIAKISSTRQKRIDQIVESVARGEKIRNM
jgi:uncharacterized protein YdeI (YjbR/CyaY-like superfamily)